jgi:hypothetical protein
VIFHYANGALGRRQPQHGFDEIAARGPKAAGTEDAAGSDHERLFQICLSVQFAGQFRNAIGAQGSRTILFGVGASGGPIENVVGGKVDELRVQLTARHGQIADRESVGDEGRLRLSLGNVHLVVGGGVEHYFGIRLRENLLDARGVGNVNVGTLETFYRVAALGELADQLHSELPAASEDNNFSLIHSWLRIAETPGPSRSGFARPRHRPRDAGNDTGVRAVVSLDPKSGGHVTMRYLSASAITVFIIATGPALPAQTLKAASGTSGANSVLVARHIIGLEKISSQKGGRLSVQDGAMKFEDGKDAVQVPAPSIDAIFVGSETTQGGGKVGRVVKTAAIAAPFESGKVLTLLMRTKVDILTVSYRDAGGALHAAIFAVPIGQASDLRTRLVAAGARDGAGQELKERAQP